MPNHTKLGDLNSGSRNVAIVKPANKSYSDNNGFLWTWQLGVSADISSGRMSVAGYSPSFTVSLLFPEIGVDTPLFLQLN